MVGQSRMRLFKSIPVVPPRELYLGSVLADGGPIWPNFERRGPVRFNRHKPLDRRPHPYAGEHIKIDAPCVWCGFAQNHFGHLIAEHLTRVVESLSVRPDDLYLFVTYPKGDQSGVPDFFWSIIDWYGLPRSQVRFVTEPTVVSELRCMPQSERLFGKGPSQDYLALLDLNTLRNGLAPKSSDILYVTRAGQLEFGRGGHAGEGYLVKLLQSLGVSVLDPGKSGLMEQLASYAGAKTLVFAEGSAMHGRQLLGRVRQNIVILRRRLGKSVAKELLERRCDELVYSDTIYRFAAPIGGGGQVKHWEGISFYDTEALFSAFRDIGLDLESKWSDAEFLSARDADVLAWLDCMGRLGRLSNTTIAAISAVFEDVGLDPFQSAPP